MPAFRASIIRYPRPEVTAIISAATTTNQAMPSASRTPVRICGKAAGKMTFLNSVVPLTPKFWAARRWASGIFCTAAIEAVMTGNKLARKIRKIGARSLTPNHKIATGIQAIGEIGRNTWMTGLNAWKARPDQPIVTPIGMPITSASEKPAIKAASAALNGDLFVGEWLSPKLDPDIIDKEEDDRMILKILRNQFRNEAVSKFVHESRSLCLQRITGSQAHRPVSESRVTRPFVDHDGNGAGLKV